MSRAVAIFININILCKAAMNSGCDVITPLKTITVFYSRPTFLFTFVLLSSLPRVFPAQLCIIFSSLTVCY